MNENRKCVEISQSVIYQYMAAVVDKNERNKINLNNEKNKNFEF